MARSRPPERRHILCTSCDGLLEVAGVAKSVACSHCHSRVVTEAMDIDGYVAVRHFATANRLRIRRKGIVFASVRAEEIEVEGVLQGEAFALGAIRIGKGARVAANLRATRLAVEPGATLEGELRIGPHEVFARPEEPEPGP